MQTVSQSTGIWCLRIYARLPPAFVSDPFTERIMDQVLSETSLLQNFKDKSAKLVKD